MVGRQGVLAPLLRVLLPALLALAALLGFLHGISEGSASSYVASPACSSCCNSTVMLARTRLSRICRVTTSVMRATNTKASWAVIIWRKVLSRAASVCANFRHG